MKNEQDRTPRCRCDSCGIEFDEGEKIYRCYDMLLCKTCLGETIGYDLEDMSDEEIEELGDEFFFDEVDDIDEEDIW